jgi:hypothetical protein
MKNVRLLVSCLALLLVGLVALSFPGTAAAAEGSGDFVVIQDSEQPEEPAGAIDIPGILTVLIGAAGGQQGGGLTLGSIMLESPNVNATASVNGLSFSQMGLGWDTITIAQKEPQIIGSVTISDAQATVGGPSSNFTTDISAHVETQPNDGTQAEGTFGISYDGATGQADVGFRDFSLAIDNPAVSAQIAGVSDPETGFALSTLSLGFPSADIATDLSGFTVSAAGTDWNAITLSRDTVTLGEAVELSDLNLTVAGPSGSYAGGASATVDLNAGDTAHVGGEIQAIYNPNTGQLDVMFNDGTAWVKTDAVNVELQGVHTGDSGVAIDTVLITSPVAGLDVTVSGVTMGGTDGASFQEARIKVTPTGEGPSKGFETVVTNTGAGYTVTTTSTFTFGG